MKRVTKKQKANIEKFLEIEKSLSEFREEFRKNLITLITGAFSFVAALLWKDAIQESLQPLISAGSSAVIFKYLVALVVSAIAVLVIIIMSKVLSTTREA
ncbi:MAG: DUF5654 family protein [Candidatus Aenigmatarchaeota archaeon]